MRDRIGDRHRPGTRLRLCMVFAGIALLAAACAQQSPGQAAEGPRPIPAHGFPRWVSEIETGKTGIGDVWLRFGKPRQVEGWARGGRTYRYEFREIQWPDDDPLRPVVSETGEVELRGPGFWHRVGAGLRRVSGGIASVFYFPERQPRPPRRRSLPATIHRLELYVDVEGIVQHFVYEAQPGIVRVPESG